MMKWTASLVTNAPRIPVTGPACIPAQSRFPNVPKYVGSAVNNTVSNLPSFIPQENGKKPQGSAFNVDVNNRQLHPEERKLARDLARKSGGKYTAEQIENALRNAGNTTTGESVVAGMVVDPKDRNAIYDKGAVWNVGENGTLVQVLPPQPDAELTAFIKQNTGQTYDWYMPSTQNATLNNAPRDRLTNLPLDDKGRYSQTVILDGNAYEPKYHPCATVECMRQGANLDMSDPNTQAYVKALDAQIFKDIGKGATTGALVVPVGTPGAVLGITGFFAAVGESGVKGELLNGTRDEVIKALSETSATAFFRDVLGHSPMASARAVALIDLAGGWDRFVESVKIELLGIKENEEKK